MTVPTRTWVILMTLTAFSLWAGRADGGNGIGILGTGLVLAAANFKADQILTHFLGLERAGTGWRLLFRTMLTLLGAAIFGIYALTPYLQSAPR